MRALGPGMNSAQTRTANASFSGDAVGVSNAEPTLAATSTSVHRALRGGRCPPSCQPEHQCVANATDAWLV